MRLVVAGCLFTVGLLSLTGMDGRVAAAPETNPGASAPKGPTTLEEVVRTSATRIKQNLGAVQFSICYHTKTAQSVKGRSVGIGLTVPPEREWPASERIVTISIVRFGRADAGRLVDCLARDPFLGKAVMNRMSLIQLPESDYYSMTLYAGQNETYFDAFKADAEAEKRLNRIAAALNEDGGEALRRLMRVSRDDGK